MLDMFLVWRQSSSVCNIGGNISGKIGDNIAGKIGGNLPIV